MGSYEDTKQTIVIIGAGFCGLTAAIECKLRGMHPILLEAYSGPSTHGDLLDFVANAGRVFASWDGGKVAQAIWDCGVNAAKTMDFLTKNDVLLKTENWPQSGGLSNLTFAGHRGEMHAIVFNYAVKIGVDIRCSTKVVDYIDNEIETGVVTATCERILGDCVLAADGPRSLARERLLHLPESRVNSGYAIFRAYFDITDEMLKNEAFASIVSKEEDYTKFWVARDVHGLIYTWGKGTQCAWVLTHKDDADIGESWSLQAKKEDVFKYIEGWTEIWQETIRITPENRIIDYKLVWRDPLETWLSPTKRGALMGDAAHCHLPTSAQGACQAVEDAAVVAICLEKAKGNIQVALQVFERIRYNRSHIIHASSISTRDMYHNIEWTPELVAENPDALDFPLYEWIVDFDCQKDAEENFDRLAADVINERKGTIQELSIPAGGNYDKMKMVEPPLVQV